MSSLPASVNEHISQLKGNVDAMSALLPDLIIEFMLQIMIHYLLHFFSKENLSYIYFMIS